MLSSDASDGVAETALTLADVGEDGLLDRILPRLRSSAPDLVVGPGDDTALLATGPTTLVTTDAMVRGQDWLDEWSTGVDVGCKAVAQNLADIAAMGGRPTGIVVVLLADPATTVGWAEDLADGLALATGELGVAVLGGDLSSAAPGMLAVAVTALGELDGLAPVRRGGARPGDQVAVAGGLGRAAAGWTLLSTGRGEAAPELVGWQLRPRPPYEAGPVAARAGATAMIDLSDGLGRDADRVARASGVRVELFEERLAPYAAALAEAVGARTAWECVLGGGEDHSLLACFPAESVVPGPFAVVGQIRAGEGAWCAGKRLRRSGWDHFGG
ncbi:MAG TPA: thiamine-phosphate kinase [Dermatophilaceae bacterium]|nr:thiamine-phosphate kinase [Dermatophilaceae bacterium]